MPNKIYLCLLYWALDQTLNLILDNGLKFTVVYARIFLGDNMYLVALGWQGLMFTLEGKWDK